MGIHSEAQLDQRFLAFARLLNKYLQHFPKFEKYGLAMAIRQCAYDVYGLIVEGQKRYFKKTSLTQLDIRHEQLYPRRCGVTSAGLAMTRPQPRSNPGLSDLTAARKPPNQPQRETAAKP